MSEAAPPKARIRFPRPLAPGDTIGITAVSAGVAPELRPRLDVAVEILRDSGYEVRLGGCLDTPSHVSAPAAERAAEFQDMLLDPSVAVVIPPWGGELGIDAVGLVDWDRLAGVEPTWVVGFSDVSTFLLPLTVRSGMATLHGQNLMDTPYRVPPEQRSWLDVVTMPRGSVFSQFASPMHREPGFDDWQTDPQLAEHPLTRPGRWRRLDGDGEISVSGRLIGGCIEAVANLAGTPFGDVPGFARSCPEGTLVYLEAAESGAYEIGRRLHGLRLAGWFDNANAVLLGRTHAPDSPGLTQHGAALDALQGLGIPIVADVDCGHVAPFLAIVNGALGRVELSAERQELRQWLAAGSGSAGAENPDGGPFA